MNIWRVLVSSPNDVKDERDSISRAIHSVNLALEASGKDLRLQVGKWETDVPPGLHERGGQGQIESTLHFADCDILIGIFWKRFGTHVLGDKSGTEREIRLGRKAWRSKGRPKVMVFFSTAAFQSRTTEEARQILAVLEFKEKMKSEGLVCEYSDAREFEALATRHLLTVCLGANEATRFLASPISCHVLASPVEVHMEGLTERVGDLRLFFSLDREATMREFRKAQPADMPSPDVDFAAWLTARNMVSVPLLVDVEVELSTTRYCRAGGAS
jgi:hypothetical protein